ncbi:type IIS restriction enzyme R and M protein, partial [gut metagenome]
MYCLFYERGWQLLKKNGHLCYITSNKWMRAGYGEKTRDFFANNTNPQLLIDFSGVKIFESATVDTNILLFSKATNEQHTVCAITNKQNKDSVKELSVFVQQHHSVCSFTASDSWVILSEIEQSIKRKIEAVGTPLKDWNINIYRGVLTGYNKAFIISTEKRNEILENCQTEDERKRTEELIRPILRGRDIKRYGYDWAGLWLINT